MGVGELGEEIVGVELALVDAIELSLVLLCLLLHPGDMRIGAREQLASGLVEGLEQEAQDFQIPPVPVNAVEKDRLEVKKVYMGLVFLYQEKHESKFFRHV